MKMIIFMVSILLAGLLHAQETVLIWPDTPPFSKPNALKETVKESWGVPCVYNVTKPTLTVYAAKGENSGRSMIILPGGGYEVESFVAEGSQIAEHLSSNGILAAVLKYRLPHPESSDQPHLLPITDARQAISVLRSKAAEYGIDAEKVGIMGFSAGGHLATAVSVLRSKNANENPDYSALVYAVTTLGPDNQKWLEESLYHRAMTEEEKARYSLVTTLTTKHHLPFWCMRMTTKWCRSRNLNCMRKHCFRQVWMWKRIISRTEIMDSVPAGKATAHLSGWDCLRTGLKGSRII